MSANDPKRTMVEPVRRLFAHKWPEADMPFDLCSAN